MVYFTWFYFCCCVLNNRAFKLILILYLMNRTIYTRRGLLPCLLILSIFALYDLFLMDLRHKILP